ncbi:MAG: HAD-IA family hydrolase [Phycisphaerales bacterium]
MVVFDWGGVVLRICRSWREGCERAGVELHDHRDSSETGPDRLALLRAYETGQITHADFLRGLARLSGGRYTPDEIDAVHAAWLIEEYPGMPALIERLVEASASLGLSTGLLSNTNARHWETHLPLAEGGSGRFPAVRQLHHRHASHLLGLAKPELPIYRAFEAETGFGATDILFFDDREDNIDAARRAGWRAERIDPDGDPASQIRSLLAAHGLAL